MLMLVHSANYTPAPGKANRVAECYSGSARLRDLPQTHIIEIKMNLHRVIYFLFLSDLRYFLSIHLDIPSKQGCWAF